MPITSPVERISGPSTESTTWPSTVRNRLNGSTASFTDTGESSGTIEPSCAGSMPSATSERMLRPTMMSDAAFASGIPSAFDTNGTVRRRPRVGLEHVEHALADRELHVEQPHHADALGDRERRVAHPVDHVAAERDRRQRARRVARVDAGLLDVLHDAADVELGAVVERVDVDLDRVVEEPVDQQRASPGR